MPVKMKLVNLKDRTAKTVDLPDDLNDADIMRAAGSDLVDDDLVTMTGVDGWDVLTFKKMDRFVVIGKLQLGAPNSVRPSCDIDDDKAVSIVLTSKAN